MKTILIICKTLIINIVNTLIIFLHHTFIFFLASNTYISLSYDFDKIARGQISVVESPVSTKVMPSKKNKYIIRCAKSFNRDDK